MISPSDHQLDIPRQVSPNRMRSVWFCTGDPLVAAGVEAFALRLGAEGRLRPISPEELIAALEAGSGPDLLYLWLDDPTGLDALAVVDPLPTVLTAGTQVVAVTQRRLHSVAKLRLAEAGVGWLADRRWLADAIVELAEDDDQLAGLLPPERFALPDATDLRQRMGFAPRGQLLALMEAARQHPSKVWTSNLPQSKLLSRGEVMALRNVAGLAAGLPEPPFSKHACSTKNAPSLPEWNDLKRVIRLAMGLSEQP